MGAARPRCCVVQKLTSLIFIFLSKTLRNRSELCWLSTGSIKANEVRFSLFIEFINFICFNYLFSVNSGVRVILETMTFSGISKKSCYGSRFANLQLVTISTLLV